jgi:hypothetical protein
MLKNLIITTAVCIGTLQSNFGMEIENKDIEFETQSKAIYGMRNHFRKIIDYPTNVVDITEKELSFKDFKKEINNRIRIGLQIEAREINSSSKVGNNDQYSAYDPSKITKEISLYLYNHGHLVNDFERQMKLYCQDTLNDNEKVNELNFDDLVKVVNMLIIKRTPMEIDFLTHISDVRKIKIETIAHFSYRRKPDITLRDIEPTTYQNNRHATMNNGLLQVMKPTINPYASVDFANAAPEKQDIKGKDHDSLLLQNNNGGIEKDKKQINILCNQVLEEEIESEANYFKERHEVEKQSQVDKEIKSFHFIDPQKNDEKVENIEDSGYSYYLYKPINYVFESIANIFYRS